VGRLSSRNWVRFQEEIGRKSADSLLDLVENCDKLIKSLERVGNLRATREFGSKFEASASMFVIESGRIRLGIHCELWEKVEMLRSGKELIRNDVPF
jgi:hypothetical protein